MERPSDHHKEQSDTSAPSRLDRVRAFLSAGAQRRRPWLHVEASRKVADFLHAMGAQAPLAEESMAQPSVTGQPDQPEVLSMEQPPEMPQGSAEQPREQ